MKGVGDVAYKAFTAGLGAATIYLAVTFSINVYRGLSWHTSQSTAIGFAVFILEWQLVAVPTYIFCKTAKQQSKQISAKQEQLSSRRMQTTVQVGSRKDNNKAEWQQKQRKSKRIRKEKEEFLVKGFQLNLLLDLNL